MTPEELRQAARELRAEARRLDAEADAHEVAAAAIERARGVITVGVSVDAEEVGVAREQASLLTTAGRPNTLNAMTAAATIDPDVLRSEANTAPAHREHPFLVAMREDGETILIVCDWLEKKFKRQFHRNTVQGWYASRHIPRSIAEAIRVHYGKDKRGRDRVPLSCWHRIKG